MYELRSARRPRTAQRFYRQWWPWEIILWWPWPCNPRRFFRRLLLREFPCAALPAVLLLHVGRCRGQSACRLGRHNLGPGRHNGLWVGLARHRCFWRSPGRLRFAAVRPGKVIGSAGWGSNCLALRQNLDSGGVAVNGTAAGATKQLIGIFRRCSSGQRDHGPCQRPLGRLRPGWRWLDQSGGQRHGHSITYISAQFVFDITRELDRSRFGEKYAIAQAQPAHLALIVGPVI